MLDRTTTSFADRASTKGEGHRPTLDALQALRALAAFLVVCDHAIFNMVEKLGAKADLAFAHFLGGLGVTTFFAISGFVMIYAHGRDFGEPGATRRFYSRRIGRIVPLYWALTLLYAGKLALEGRAPGLAALAQSLAFLPFQMPGAEYGQPVLGQGWTLNYEMLFYFVFGLALLVPRGVGLVFVVFAVTTGLGLAGVFGHDNPFAYWARPIVLFFLGGIVIGLLRPWVTRGPGFDLALGLVTLIFGSAIAVALAVGAHSVAAYVALALASLSAVAACAWAAENPQRAPHRIVAKHLGDATYSIYLIHTLVIGVAIKLVASRAPECPVWLFVAAMVPLTAVVGVGVYRLVERPLIREWAALFGTRRTPAIAKRRAA